MQQLKTQKKRFLRSNKTYEINKSHLTRVKIQIKIMLSEKTPGL